MICTKCGNKNNAGDNFCTFCGEELSAAAAFCPFCGGRVEGEICGKCYRNVNTGAKVCPKCGFPTAGSAKFCIKCGSSIEPPKFTTDEREQRSGAAFETILPIEPKIAEKRVYAEPQAPSAYEPRVQERTEFEQPQPFCAAPEFVPEQPEPAGFAARFEPEQAANRQPDQKINEQPAQDEKPAEPVSQKAAGQQAAQPNSGAAAPKRKAYVSPLNAMYKNKKTGGNFIWAVLGFFVPLAGYILLGVWLHEKKTDAMYAGIGAAVGTVVIPIISYILFAFLYSGLLIMGSVG